jgi:hypothetical protein
LGYGGERLSFHRVPSYLIKKLTITAFTDVNMNSNSYYAVVLNNLVNPNYSTQISALVGLGETQILAFFYSIF